ncbi:hypothetical protein [Paenibacillus radicis (ex Gao et al. 2016)]|uniref:Uncharacterized protein n=1 Tax=Paenibacillus radicis (ex Gao et al. 2016) TaxID=1737354 RepID=A0A917GZQ5_9BACL|nr:hypothetical protein [Paenibacillus radicis (ex Gao et al. 2016)]GGG62830.1 hypothetical protein GCM10010918_15800 [Paenibacillus radicis (ex Gao et al. 2016)]
MDYMEYLSSNSEVIQCKVENALEKYRAEPVGDGYIDIITDFQFVEGFILELTSIGIAINRVTWWCHCYNEKKGCPHGMGGPQSQYNEGWYSELGNDIDVIEISQSSYELLEQEVSLDRVKAINETILNGLIKYSKSERFRDCDTPALWLHVPDEWKRLNTMK